MYAFLSHMFSVMVLKDKQTWRPPIIGLHVCWDSLSECLGDRGFPLNLNSIKVKAIFITCIYSYFKTTFMEEQITK